MSFTVHRILASVADEDERWAAMEDAPFNPRTGARQWTPDGAKRVVGQRVDRPVTVDERVQAVADLTRDDEVAAQLATDLPKRPAVTEHVTPAERVRVVTELTTAVPLRRQARPLAEHYGDLVRVAPMEARPAGLRTYQLMAATRLTRSQVGRGIRHVRDVVAADHLTPTTWTRQDGFMFSDDPADWIEYDKRQFRQNLGRLTRVGTGTLDPHLARYPDDEWTQLATADRGDADDLVD